jgi:hypothetical protein
VKRSAIAANVERRAADQRSQLGQIKFTHLEDGAPGVAGCVSGLLRDASRGAGVRRTGGEHNAAPRIGAHKAAGEIGERLCGPPPERITCAHVNHDEGVVGMHTGARESPVNRCGDDRIHWHLCRIGLGARRGDAKRQQKVPLRFD